MRLVSCVMRRSIHMGRIVPEIEQDLEQKIVDKSVDVKLLKTRRKFGHVSLPAILHTLAESKLASYANRDFRQEAKYLVNVMYKIKMPDDKHSISQKKADIKLELELRDKIKEPADHVTEEDKLYEEEVAAKIRLNNLIQGKLDERRRDWHYYEYDERAALMYLGARLAPNYACVKTVMNEIKQQLPSFTPKSVLDFGSGMGTTIWAVNETWRNSVIEFMNIDLSKEQQMLCEYLLRHGKESLDPLPGVFHRQYLPTSDKVKYDLVVAAFSMLELPNADLRAHVMENLWQKTNDMLIIVERGNKAGFDVINEARHFVLDLSGHDVTKKLNLTFESRPTLGRIKPTGHVLGPCPHDLACPRVTMSTKDSRNICRFRVSFEPLEMGERKSGTLHEEFSFVILRKGAHASYDSQAKYFSRWPRIVDPRLKRGSQIIFRLCCPNGNLAETIITKTRYGKASFNLAKSCDWGDQLPIKAHDTYESPSTRRIKDR